MTAFVCISLIVTLGVIFKIFSFFRKRANFNSGSFVVGCGMAAFLVAAAGCSGGSSSSGDDSDYSGQYEYYDESEDEQSEAQDKEAARIVSDLTLEWLKIEKSIQEYNKNVIYKTRTQSGDYGVSEMYQIRMLIERLYPLANQISEYDPEFGQQCLDRAEGYRTAYNETIMQSMPLQMVGVQTL